MSPKDRYGSHSILKSIRKDKYLYMLLLLPISYFLVFKYIPMAGMIVAFRKYVPGQSIFGVEWVGLKYYNMFLTDPTFWSAFKNTIILNVLYLGIGFPIPILFALLLNEIANQKFKRFVQTVSYLPRFFSTIVVVGIIKELLSPSTGIVNHLITLFGFEPIAFLNEAAWFRPIYIISDIWQFMGWNTIIYIAALTTVDPKLYEAAMMDGAGGFKRTIHITIPSIMPTIVITFIFAVGSLLTVGFEKVFLLQNPVTYSTADVIDTFVIRRGLQENNYSYATAAGLMSSIIALILILGTNRLAKKYSDSSLF